MYLQLVFVFLTVFKIATAEKCLTPNNEEAECVSIYTCPILLNAVKTKEPEFIEFVRKSKCGERESDRLVCCGTFWSLLPPSKNIFNKEKLLPARTYCGYQHSDDYFRNETAIGINEFPWLAVLQYRSRNNVTKTLCSGSLISNRYVLTAAHCISQTRPELIGVRLGEYNVKTTKDCTQDSNFYECSDPPQDFGIEKKIPHPHFNLRRRVHDIGLLRLNKIVEYSDYVRPICLPTPSGAFAKPGDILLTSGWGRKELYGEPTETKKKILTKLITNEECAAVHEKYEDILTKGHICTRELEENTQFSCRGDGGGPVIFSSSKSQWQQEGLLVLGFRCHLGYPEVYTKVVNYLNWIKENIEP